MTIVSQLLHVHQPVLPVAPLLQAMKCIIFFLLFLQVKGKKKPKYYGTVAPYPNFNASNDVAVLQDAIESKGAVSTLSIYLSLMFSQLKKEMNE